MPKRAYPFEEDRLPQLKVHVGQRQINNGISSDVRMKNVYDKTLGLLKEGVKALSRKLKTSEQGDPIDLPSPKAVLSRIPKSKRLFKQTILNDKLQLKAADKTIIDNGRELCGCCQVLDRRTTNTCYYCDQVLCPSCLSECIGCLESFCQNCILPVYDADDKSTCLNCYR